MLRQATLVRAMPQTYRRTLEFLSYLLIATLAIVPRVLDLGVFVTHDEVVFWMRRSEVFLNAIQTGDYAATAISNHPGVTTMWLGGFGILLQRTLHNWGLIIDLTFPIRLALMQLPVALVHVVGVIVGYRLLRQMVPAITALLAALLWATDPFLIGYSRILHVDALAATFTTLSLLAACVYWYHERRPATLLLSSICAGLGFLSKSPALAVVPIVAGIAVMAGRPGQMQNEQPSSEAIPLRTRLRQALPALFAWGIVYALTILALWPALWVVPGRVYELLRIGVEVEGSNPHELGNFFLGRKDDAPGLLFYPVAVALHTTPWTLLGLLALPLALRRIPRATRRDVIALAAFVILFTVAMSPFPKKFDRYIVPIFPEIDILAAVGLLALVDTGLMMVGRFKRQLATYQRQSVLQTVLLSGVTLLAISNIAFWHPYSIDSFNQLFGGTANGARTFRVGWGEGLEQAAAWLNQQPDITGVVTASTQTDPLQRYLRGGAQATTPSGTQMPAQTGYVVIYIRDVQDGHAWPPFDQFYQRVVPKEVVRIHGVEFAWIYQVPPPVGQVRPADFGEAIHLRGFDLAATAKRGQQMTLKLAWQTKSVPSTDYTLFAHLIGEDGQRYAQADPPYPTKSWKANSFISTEVPLTIPDQAPSGIYHLVIGLYNPKTGQRLPLTTTTQLNPARDGPDALPLAQVVVK